MTALKSNRRTLLHYGSRKSVPVLHSQQRISSAVADAAVAAAAVAAAAAVLHPIITNDPHRVGHDCIYIQSVGYTHRKLTEAPTTPIPAATYNNDMFQPSNSGKRRTLPSTLDDLMKQPKSSHMVKQRHRSVLTDAVEPKMAKPNIGQLPPISIVLPTASSVSPAFVVTQTSQPLPAPIFTTLKSMRQKNLDYSKPLPIFNAEDTTEVLLRASQQLVTGIDKEEEYEYHLQQARDKRGSIPVTRTLKVPKTLLETEYKPLGIRHCNRECAVAGGVDDRFDSVLAYLILEADICEYNADTEDVKWVNEQGCLLGIDVNKFEEYMEMLERTVSPSSASSVPLLVNMDDFDRSSVAGGSVASFGNSLSASFINNAYASGAARRQHRYSFLSKHNGLSVSASPGPPFMGESFVANALFARLPNVLHAPHFSGADSVKRYIAGLHSDSASIALYDYWLDKRCRAGRSLIPRVKTERKDGLNAKDPYVAFRRRTEKVQTRKNRRNEKMAYAALLRMAPEYTMLNCLLDQKILSEQITMEEINQERQLLSAAVALKDVDGVVFGEIERRVEHDSSSFHWPAGGGGGMGQQRGVKRIAVEYSASQFGDDCDDFSSHNGSVVSSAPTSKTQASLADGNRRKKRKKVKRDLPDPAEARPVQFADTFAVTHSPYDSFDDTNSPDGRYSFLRKAYCVYQPPCFTEVEDDENNSNQEVDESAFPEETTTAGRNFPTVEGFDSGVEDIDGTFGGVAFATGAIGTMPTGCSFQKSYRSHNRPRHLQYTPVVVPEVRGDSQFFPTLVPRGILRTTGVTGGDAVSDDNGTVPPPVWPKHSSSKRYGRPANGEAKESPRLASLTAPLRQPPLISFSTYAAAKSGFLDRESSTPLASRIETQPVPARESRIAWQLRALSTPRYRHFLYPIVSPVRTTNVTLNGVASLYLPVFGRRFLTLGSEPTELQRSLNCGSYVRASLGRRGLALTRLKTPFDPYLEECIEVSSHPDARDLLHVSSLRSPRKCAGPVKRFCTLGVDVGLNECTSLASVNQFFGGDVIHRA